MRQFNPTSRTLRLIAAKLRSTNKLFTLSLLLSAVAIVGIAVGLRVTNARSGSGPDYSQVHDFTNGGKHLLRNDDMVMTFSGPSKFHGLFLNRNYLSSLTTALHKPPDKSFRWQSQ